MSIYIRAWNSIVEEWPEMNKWQKLFWVVFFIPLYILTMLAIYSAGPPPDGKNN
jgi:hypothetical protein